MADNEKCTRIVFTTIDGQSATEFDTQDTAELLQLFHWFLDENGMELTSVDDIEYVTM